MEKRGEEVGRIEGLSGISERPSLKSGLLSRGEVLT
jgi:hypothetical protein